MNISQQPSYIAKFNKINGSSQLSINNEEDERLERLRKQAAEMNKRRKLQQLNEKNKQQNGIKQEVTKPVEPVVTNKNTTGQVTAEPSTGTTNTKKQPKTTQQNSSVSKQKKQSGPSDFVKQLYKDDQVSNNMIDTWVNKKLNDIRSKEVIPVDQNGNLIAPIKPIKVNVTNRDITDAVNDQIDKTYSAEIKQHEDIINELNSQLDQLKKEYAAYPTEDAESQLIKSLTFRQRSSAITKAINDENERWETSSAYYGIQQLKNDIETTVDPNKYTAALFNQAFKNSLIYQNTLGAQNHYTNYPKKNTPVTVTSNVGSPNFPMYNENTVNTYSAEDALNKVKIDKKVDDLEEHADRVRKYMSIMSLPKKYDSLPDHIKNSLKKIKGTDILYDSQGNLKSEYNAELYFNNDDIVKTLSQNIGDQYRKNKNKTTLDIQSQSITEKDLSKLIEQNQNKIDFYSMANGDERLTQDEKQYVSESLKNLGNVRESLTRAQAHIDWNRKIKESDGAWGGLWSVQNAKNIGYSAMHTLSDPDFLSFGLFGLTKAIRQNDIKKKLDNGEKLNSSEKDFLNAMAIEDVFHNTHGAYEKVGGWITGDMTVNSMLFMTEFMLTGGMHAMTTAGGKQAMKSASEAYLKKYVRDFGKRSVKQKMMQHLVQTPGMLQYATGELLYSIALANSLQGMQTWADVYKGMLGNLDYSIDEDGNVDIKGFKGGNTFLESLGESITQHTIENFSESTFGHMFTAPIKYGAKGLGLGKLVDKISARLLSNKYTARPYAIVRGVNEFAKAGQYDGIFEEIGEEYAGKLYEHLTGVSQETKEITDKFGDKRQVKTSFWEEVDPFTERGQRTAKEIIGGIAFSSALMGFSGMVSHAKASRNYNNAKQILSQEIGKENAQKIEDAILDSDSDINVQNLIQYSLERGVRNSKQKEALMNYIGALTTYQATSTVLQERIENSDDEIFARALEDAKLNGYSITTAMQKDGLTKVLGSLKQLVASNVNTTEEELDQLIEDGELLNMANYYQENGDVDIADQLIGLQLVQTQYEAMQQRVQDDIDLEIGRNAKYIQNISSEDGRIRIAKLKSEEEQEHIKTIKDLQDKIDKETDEEKQHELRMQIHAEEQRWKEADHGSSNEVFIKTSLTSDSKLPSGKIMIVDKNTNEASIVDSESIDTNNMTTLDANVVLHDNNMSTYRRRLAQNDVDTVPFKEGGSVSMVGDRVATIQGRTPEGRVVYSVNDGTTEIIRLADEGVTEQELVQQWTNDYLEEQKAYAIQNAKQIRTTPRRNRAAEVAATKDVIKYLNSVSREQRKDLEQSHGRAIEFANDRKLSREEAKSILNYAKRTKSFKEFVSTEIKNKILPKAKYWKRLSRLYKALQNGQLDDEMFLAIISPETSNLNEYQKKLLENLTVTDNGDVSFARSAKDVAGYTITTSGAKQNYSEDDLRDADEMIKKSYQDIINNKNKKEEKKSAQKVKPINEKRAARKKRNLEKAERRRELARRRNARKKGINIEAEVRPTQTDINLEVTHASNDKQTKTLNKLNQLVNQTKANVLREQTTSHNYFIVVNGVRKMFTRVHGIIDDLFVNEGYDISVAGIIQKLTKVWNDTKDINQLKNAIEESNTSDEDLSMYTSYLDENQDEQSVADVIEGVAHVVTPRQVGPSVDIGNIMDQLCRMFFGGETMSYEDIKISALDEEPLSKYMSKDTFDNIIKQIQDLKDIYNALGWTLVTEPCVFTTEKFDKNIGRTVRVAGETDMVAIDTLGNVHIIDFKTSYKAFDSFIVNGEVHNLFEEISQYKGRSAKMSTKEYYSQQLTMYSMMVESSLESQVSTIEILPWTMKYDPKTLYISNANNKARVLNNTGTEMYSDILVPQRIPLVFDRGIIDRFTPYSEEDLKEAKRKFDEFFDNPIHELIIDEYYISGAQESDKGSLIQSVTEYNEEAQSVLNGLSNLSTVDDYNQALMKLYEMLHKKTVIETRMWQSIDDNNHAKDSELQIQYDDVYESYLIQQLRNAFFDKYDSFINIVSHVYSLDKAGSEIIFTKEQNDYYNQLVSDIVDLIETNSHTGALNLDGDIVDKFQKYVEYIQSKLGSTQLPPPKNPIRGIPVVTASNDWKSKNTIRKTAPTGYDGIESSTSITDPNIKLISVIDKPDFIKNAKFHFTTDGNRLLVNIEYGGHKFKPCLVSTSNIKEKSIFGRVMQFVRRAGKNQIVVPSILPTRTFGEIKTKLEYTSLEKCGLVSTDGKNGVSIYDIEFNSTQSQIGVSYHTDKIQIVDGKPVAVPVTEVRVPLDEETAKRKAKEQQMTNKESFTPDSPYALRFGSAIHTYSATDTNRPSDGAFVWMMNLGYEENPTQAVPITLHRANLSEQDVNFIADALLGKYNNKVRVYEQSKSIDMSMSVSANYTLQEGFGGDLVVNGETINVPVIDMVDLLIPTVGGHSYVEMMRKHDMTKTPPVYLDATNVNTTGEVTINGNVTGDISEPKTFNIKTKDGLDDFKKYLSENVLKSININGFAQMRLSQAQVNNQSSNTPLSTSAFGRTSLQKYVEEHGELVLGNSSIRFDVDDFTGNGKGVTGMGWYIKRGFLTSNYDSIDSPLIGFDDATTGVFVTENASQPSFENGHPADQNNGTGVPLIEQQEKAVVDQKVSQLDLLDKINQAAKAGSRSTNIEDFIGGFTHIQFGTAKNPINKEKALSELQRILGTEGLSIKFKDIFAYGWNVVGLCKADSILLSESAEAGVEYHEAFHRIVELLFDPKQRDLVYKLYRHALLKRGRKNLSDLQVAEALADEFMNYMQEKPTVKYNNRVLNFFREAKYEIKALFKIGSWRLYKLYTEINSGKYANVLPTQEQIDAFNERVKSYGGLNERLKGFAYEKQGVQFKFIANSMHYKKLINFIAMSFYNSSVQNIRWDGSNIEKMSIEKDMLLGTTPKGFFDIEDKTLDQYPTFFTRYLHSENVPEKTRLALQELLDNYELIKRDIANVVAEYATDYKEIRDENYAMSKDGSGNSGATSEEDMYNGEGGDNWYSKSSYEYSPLEKTSQRVKFFFSAVPKLTWSNGEVVPVLNELGLPEMYSPSYSYISVLNKCSNCQDIYDLLNKLAQYGKIDPMYSIIYDRLHDLVQKMKEGSNEATATVAQIFTQVKSANHEFVLIKSNKLSNGKFEMGIENTSARYQSRKYMQAWSMQFANGSFRYIKRNEDGTYSAQNEGTQGISNLVAYFVQFIEKTPKSHEELQNSEEEWDPGKLATHKEILCRLINLCGFQFTPDMLNEYLESSEQYNYSADIPSYLAFIDNNRGNIDSFLQKIGGLVNASDGTLNIDKSGKIFGTNINQYFNRDNFVRELAKAKYSWHRAHDQMVSLIAGDAKAYAKSENNQIDDRLEEIMHNEKEQNNLKSYVFNMKDKMGSIILKNIGAKLKFNVHSGFKNHEVGNSGVDYQKLSKREDYIAKATILLEGGLLIPTMSDKKSFGYIEGLKDVLAQLFESVDYTKPLSEAVIPDAVIDQLLEYTECEDAAVQQALAAIKNKQLTNHDLITNYHGRKIEIDGVKHIVVQGARYCSMLGIYEGDKFIEFNKLKDENGNYLTEENCYNIAHEKFFDKPIDERRELLRDVLIRNLRKELKNLESLGLIEQIPSSTNTDELFTYKNIGLDDKRIDDIYTKIVGNKENQLTSSQISACESRAICCLVGEIMVRHIISMQEFDRCFAGNTAFFKWEYDSNGHLINTTKDKSKRLGGLVSTGTNNCLDIPNLPKEYTCVEADNDILVSSYAEELKQRMYETSLRDQYAYILCDQLNIKYSDSDIDERIQEIDSMSIDEITSKILELSNGEQILDVVKATAKAKSDAFNKVDVADGGAYVSAEMCKNMLKMVGSWNSKIAKAFDILQGVAINPKTKKPYTANDTREVAHAYKLIQTEVVGAQKYTAYGFRYQSGLAVPYYNKMALFPLFKNMCTGNMAKLYDAVTKQGIDMVMINSAVKLGSQDNAKINWDDDLMFNLFLILENSLIQIQKNEI